MGFRRLNINQALNLAPRPSLCCVCKITLHDCQAKHQCWLHSMDVTRHQQRWFGVFPQASLRSIRRPDIGTRSHHHPSSHSSQSAWTDPFEYAAVLNALPCFSIHHAELRSLELLKVFERVGTQTIGCVTGQSLQFGDR